MNDCATFVYEGVRYEVDVDGVNCHDSLIVQLPDETTIRLDFPRNSLAPTVTRVESQSTSNEPVRRAWVYVLSIEFPAFGRRYMVVVPEGESSCLDESLAALPDGRYVVLSNPHDVMDPPFEQLVRSNEPLFVAAKRAGRIYEAHQIG